MKLSDFDFDLPEALIATRPARPRTSARLLLAEGKAPVQNLQQAEQLGNQVAELLRAQGA